ncbi:HAMP domain-containing sensor histidine kinase [Streptomyces sp. B6B3]|uniref:sensor histidine kinase n=1 Tax=Streptomyces sp. B6B3 TaxID=3153570 RepID=UPI00325F5508
MRALARLPRPRSLRDRLILGVTLLALAAVLASQTAGQAVVNSVLLDQVDRQLAVFHVPSELYRDVTDPDGVHGSGQGPGPFPTDFHVRFYDSAGRLVDEVLGEDRSPGPQLPGTANHLDLRPGHPVTLPATDGEGRWRVLLQEPGPDGMLAVVALPLDNVDDAISTLMVVNLVLCAIAVVGLLLLGHAAVRLGLLPLTRVERTARRITAGDLDLRLPDTDDRTEIGRLSRVLNTTLERLHEALRQRQASEERLRRFVADAGHELRTPLTAIQGFAELTARDDRLPEHDRREASRLIAQNAERMSLLIDDLTLLARLDREPTYAREPVDLLSVAADAITATAVQHVDRRVDLAPLSESDGAELDLVETTGDPHRLRQVAVNLLTNALVHTPPATPVHVRVGTTVASPRRGTDRPGRSSTSPPLLRGVPIHVLEVTDEGPGLTPADAARVFERFYRAGPAHPGEGRNSGLGLTIAATIAQAHGGRLELDVHDGCTFRLVLPADPHPGPEGPG